jgi:hypothetical protein
MYYKCSKCWLNNNYSVIKLYKSLGHFFENQITGVYVVFTGQQTREQLQMR